MVKITTIIVVLAACVAFARAETEVEGMPRYGGYNCPGQITEIRCDEDQNGLLQSISFFNPALGGWTCFGANCPNGTAGVVIQQQDGPPGTSFPIPPGSSIVSVTACRGKWYGYTSATFYLDDGTQFTCGRASGDYKPPGYDKWGGDYRNYRYKTGYRGGKGRRLQNFGGKAWGWSSRCQTYKSQKQPIWATNPRGRYAPYSGTPNWAVPNTAWADSFLNSQKATTDRYWGPAYVPRGSPSSRWTAYTWMPPRDVGNKPIQYYRKWRDYRQQYSMCRRRKCGYNPGYYYSQVYPLASFKASVDADGYVYNLYGWCFSNSVK
eukprot:gene6342-6576_t